jgi:hypothetical protein
MNAKEQIIRLLKREIAYFKASDLDTTELYNIIAATESAIFDVPSEEEIEKQIINQYDYWVIGFVKDGINFILNYKKPEPDGK